MQTKLKRAAFHIISFVLTKNRVCKLGPTSSASTSAAQVLLGSPTRWSFAITAPTGSTRPRSTSSASSGRSSLGTPFPRRSAGGSAPTTSSTSGRGTTPRGRFRRRRRRPRFPTWRSWARPSRRRRRRGRRRPTGTRACARARSAPTRTRRARRRPALKGGGGVKSLAQVPRAPQRVRPPCEREPDRRDRRVLGGVLVPNADVLALPRSLSRRPQCPMRATRLSLVGQSVQRRRVQRLAPRVGRSLVGRLPVEGRRALCRKRAGPRPGGERKEARPGEPRPPLPQAPRLLRGGGGAGLEPRVPRRGARGAAPSGAAAGAALPRPRPLRACLY